MLYTRSATGIAPSLNARFNLMGKKLEFAGGRKNNQLRNNVLLPKGTPGDW
ncbi:hypothetical protein PtB15_5B726 [Puccinia triticina]|nr:hypothetical protein PtB15_5B726 [Puccinia triticina]